MNEKFNKYLEMALRVRELNIPKDPPEDEKRNIKNIFENLKDKLNKIKTLENELVFSGKEFKTTFNIHGSIKSNHFNTIINLLRQFEKTYKEYDFDVENAKIEKRKVVVFSIDVTLNKRLRLKQGD